MTFYGSYFKLNQVSQSCFNLLHVYSHLTVFTGQTGPITWWVSIFESSQLTEADFSFSGPESARNKRSK